MLLLMVASAAIGGTLQYGYNLAIMNAPTTVSLCAVDSCGLKASAAQSVDSDLSSDPHRDADNHCHQFTSVPLVNTAFWRTNFVIIKQLGEMTNPKWVMSVSSNRRYAYIYIL